METKEAVHLYLIKKLQEMESARVAAGKMPAHVPLRDYHDAVIDDIREMLATLGDRGTVEFHPTLNSMSLHLTPEGALE